jgi:hypothetical protein
MNENSDEKDIKDFQAEDDLDLFFNDFIKKGQIEKEDEVVPGFKIKVKVLSAGELITAESVMRVNPEIPPDIVQKARCASILSQATISINGSLIIKDKMTRKEIAMRQAHLYQRLLDMPAYVVQKAYELYLEAVLEQNKLYSNPEELSKKIENF